MNVDTFELTATSTPFERAYTLPKNVSAIQILPSEDGERTKLGLITQLPEGAELAVGGPGFSEETIKVRCGGAWYFVFADDLELIRKPLAVAHA
jgi:hypothetical protein